MEPNKAHEELSAPQQAAENQDTQAPRVRNENRASASNAHRRLSSYQVFVPTEDPRNDHFVPGNPAPRPQAMPDTSLEDGPPMRRKVPSCSGLPNIWTPDMDRFIVRIVILIDVNPQPSLVKAVKDRFPELAGYAITEDAINNRVIWLDMAGNNNYFVRPMKQLAEALEKRGVQLPAPVDEAESAANHPSEEPRMKSDLEVFGSDAPMTGLLAIGCSNDDYDPYAPPLRKQSLKVPTLMDSSAPKGKATRAASTSQHGQKDIVPARHPVQIAGQPYNPAVSPHGRNFNANDDEPGTSYGRALHGNDENLTGGFYGRGIDTNIDNFGIASTSYDRPFNTTINQPRSPYDRALSPTTNVPSSPYSSTYGSANPGPTTRRPANLIGATSPGPNERAGKSPTSSALPSPRGRDIPATSGAPTSPHARTGTSGHPTIPESSSTGPGGISDSMGYLKLKDDNRGTS